MSEQEKQKRSPFPATFYVANVMEVFERLAWYGFFAVSSLYLTSPVRDGGLGFTSVQRGILQGIIPFLLYLFPVITGALADRYGYRRTFLVAFAMLTPGYFLLGQVTSFWAFFGVFLFVAIGAATFKPVVVGTVGRTTDDSNRGLGFGVFYTIVNIGGFIGPLVAGYVRVISWDYVFVMSSVWIAINFIPTLFFYKEPTTESESDNKRSLGEVLLDARDVLGNGRFALTVVPVLLLVMLAGGEWLAWKWALGGSGLWIVLNYGWNVMVGEPDGGQQRPWYGEKARVGNWPFVAYLLILSGFWASFNQIFITMPEYIRDFVDTKDLVTFAAMFGESAVNYLASVNVEALAGAITELVGEHGGFEVGETSRMVFFEMVHSKVRVPEEVLAAEFTRLAGMGAPALAAASTDLAATWAAEYRQINPEYIINLDAGAIIVFQILVSFVIQRWKPFPVLVVGTIVAGTGIAMGSIALTGFLVIIAIVVFAFGEMIASPKSQEYVARIAPKDKVALFMGYYFVSFALGNLFGGIMSGWGYQRLAKDADNPELMWILFGLVGFATAAGLLVFNKSVVPRLEAQREANK
jgi:proton-dependent oligopeptide transporter, POT family